MADPFRLWRFGVTDSDTRDVRITQDEIVTECIVVLSRFSTADLLSIAEIAERVNDKGWLPQMIREFVSVWR